MKVGDTVVSSVFFADDIIGLSDSKSQFEDQLSLIGKWCKVWGMAISPDKTKAVTLGADNKWWYTNEQMVGMCIEEEMSFKYLGIKYFPKGRDFLRDKGKDMVQKAKSYKYAILNTTGDCLDRSLVAKSVWEFVALPAILYGTEACVINQRVITELESFQLDIASFVTGIPRGSGNTALLLESGLLPIKAQYHIRLYRFFKTVCDNSDVSHIGNVVLIIIQG